MNNLLLKKITEKTIPRPIPLAANKNNSYSEQLYLEHFRHSYTKVNHHR